ncbi:hypothetical protein D9757_003686 [Collybiopsis confluens]|uniref:Uncharacterized protein n=1 Tax=Collybiopsis confluens TaxID=2823264 RepID=A0A8H5MDF2_9AGAR|nr:hypothetical protein D9757_003686 [Collybiopsis confluens]
MSSRATTPHSSPYRQTTASAIAVPPFISASKFRLQSLYSDFSGQKTANHALYHSNVDWWRRTLEAYVYEGHQGSNRLVLNADKQFVHNFTVSGVGKPSGLDTVFVSFQIPASLYTFDIVPVLVKADLSSPSHLSSSDPLPTLMSLGTFLSLAASLYAPQSKAYLTAIPSLFLSYVVAKPLWWALESAGVVGEDSLASSISSTFSSFRSAPSKVDTRWYGDYVLLHLVEQAAEAVLEKQMAKSTGPADSLYSFDSFRKEFAECIMHPREDESPLMSEIDMKVILRYLERDKGAVVVEDEIVKFSEDGQHEITAVDRGILELKSAVENLQAQIEGIQRKIDAYTAKASEALKQQRKTIALSHLRSRKPLEDLLSKRLGALANLEGTLIQVEGAAGDIEILNSYKASTVTLRSILSHPSLQRDTIDETMDAMAEANADAKEIDDKVRIGGDVAVGISNIDDDELEEELKQLVAESEREKEHQQEQRSIESKLRDIPGVPSHTVSDTNHERVLIAS